MVQPDGPGVPRSGTVSEVMAEPGAVVERSAHLAAAAYLMRHRRIPELVVIDDEASRIPVATITAFDIVRAVSHASDPSTATVAEWLSPGPTSVHAGTPLLEALDLMIDGPQPQLPVVDDDGNLIGVIDLIGVVRAVRSHLGDGAKSRPEDPGAAP